MNKTFIQVTVQLSTFKALCINMDRVHRTTHHMQPVVLEEKVCSHLLLLLLCVCACVCAHVCKCVRYSCIGHCVSHYVSLDHSETLYLFLSHHNTLLPSILPHLPFIFPSGTVWKPNQPVHKPLVWNPALFYLNAFLLSFVSLHFLSTPHLVVGLKVPLMEL